MARIHRRTIQKDLHDQDNHNGVITHLEPDSLECETGKACTVFSNGVAWKKHKLEPRLLGEISITSDMQMTPPLGQKVKN